MMKKAILSLFALILFLSSYGVAHAAWTATDNFESYTIGNAVNGLSGGTGWNGNWVAGGSSWTIVAAPSGGEGANSARRTGTGQTASRAVNNIATGEYSIMTRTTATSVSNVTYINLYAGTNVIAIVIYDTNGHIQCLTPSPTTAHDLGAYSLNTWYTIKVKWNNPVGTYAVSINGGAYSSDFNYWQGSGGDNVNKLSIESFSEGDFYIDDIKNPSAGGAAPVPELFNAIWWL